MGNLSKHPKERFQFPNTGDLYCNSLGETEIWDGDKWIILPEMSDYNASPDPSDKIIIDSQEPLDKDIKSIEEKIHAFEEILKEIKPTYHRLTEEKLRETVEKIYGEQQSQMFKDLLITGQARYKISKEEFMRKYPLTKEECFELGMLIDDENLPF